VCKTSAQILQDELHGKEMATHVQKPGGDPLQ
jgi:hypothetical protein